MKRTDKFVGYKLSPETRAAIAEEYARGDKLDDIAHRHRTNPCTVGTLARLAKLPQRRRSPRFSRRMTP